MAVFNAIAIVSFLGAWSALQ